MALEFKFLDRDRIDDVLHFFNTERSDRKYLHARPKDEFEWLFLDGYFRNACYSFVSESETGEIVATNAGILIPMISPAGDQVRTLKGEDTLISLDRTIRYGQRDILRELLAFMEEKARSENVKFIWGFTPARSAFKRCGFEVSDPVRNSILVLKPLKFYNMRIRLSAPTIKRKIMLSSFSLISWLSHKISSFTKSEFAFRQVTVETIDYDRLKILKPAGYYSLDLNREFLMWRIGRNPSGIRYGFLEFRNKKNIVVSYLVYSWSKDETCNFDHMLFDPALTTGEKLSLINISKKVISQQDAVLIRKMGFMHSILNREEMKLFRKAGFYFFPGNEPSYFIFRDISGLGIRPGDIFLSRLNTQGVV